MKQRLLRWAKRLLKITLWLAIIIALFFGIENWRAKRAWAEHLEWLKSKGETLDLAAFAPPAVPDEDNAALAPVFDCFYTVDAKTGKRAWAYRDFGEISRTLPPSQQKELKNWRLIQKWSGPLAVFNKQHGTADFAQSFGRFRENVQQLILSKEVTGLRPIPKDAVSPQEAVAGYFEQFAPMVQRIREAAQRPSCVWPLGPDKIGSGLSPGSIKGMLFQKTLALEARLALLRHDARLAHEDLMAQIKYAVGAAGLPTTIGGMVRKASRGMVCNTLLNALAAQQWDEAQWKQVVEVFPKATPVADLELFLRGERAWLNGYWESRTWRELGLMFDGIDFDPNHIPTTYRPMRYLLLVGPSGWKTRNLIAANALTQRRIEALGEEQGTMSQFFAINGSEFGSPYDFMSMRSELENQPYVEMVNGNEIVQLATLAIALERFRLKTGVFPEQLTQVVPEFLPELPKSHFDGLMPHYERRLDGLFKLWFNGIDGDDDHGRDADEPNPGGSKNDYDIVFSPPAPIP